MVVVGNVDAGSVHPHIATSVANSDTGGTTGSCVGIASNCRYVDIDDNIVGKYPVVDAGNSHRRRITPSVVVVVEHTIPSLDACPPRRRQSITEPHIDDIIDDNEYGSAGGNSPRP